MDRVGLTDRWRRFSRSSGRRPRGGTRIRDAFIPPDPTPAAGTPPTSPADAIADAGVAPPRPLVWVGTSASGSAVWSSPLANSVGMAVWAELADAAAPADAWPVLTGAVPVPSSWRLASARAVEQVAVPDGEALLGAAAITAPDVPDGIRTRLEPAADGTVEAALAAGYLALVTGVTGWQVPLAVGFDGVGAWTAAEHAAVLHRWSQHYKAQLVALTETGVGLRVGRPPRTHDAAMEAAREIAAYCPDVVVHGLGSMWALATTMAVSDTWSLRWQQ